MAAGIFIWSLATLVGSFMPNYWSFLVMRIVVGVGEAMYSTVSPTLISVSIQADIYFLTSKGILFLQDLKSIVHIQSLSY